MFNSDPMKDINAMSGYMDAGRDPGNLAESAGDFMSMAEFNNGISGMMQQLNAIGGQHSMPQSPAGMPGAGDAQQYANIPTPNKAQTMASNPAAEAGRAEVLMEPCTFTQPLNSSIRKNHSIGTYYFLKGKNTANE